MTDHEYDPARELMRLAHETDPEPVEFDTEAGLADLFERARRSDAASHLVAGVVSGNVVQARRFGMLNPQAFRLPVPIQLPVPIRTLVGQKRVLTSLDEALEATAEGPTVAVLVGARGSGRSTAAVYWLQRHRDRFPDGQLRADLGAWADHATAPAEILAGFLTSLGVDRAEMPADLELRAKLFRSLTSGRSLQILLDDAVTAAQVRQLLPGPGRSMVVVTGQGGLGGLAEHGATFVDVEPFEDDMAVELLRGYVGDRIDAEPQARDGLVELCCGRAVALSVVGRVLHDAPDLLVSDLLKELQASSITQLAFDDEPAIAALLDVGYRRLTELAQRCYRALGLHPGAGGVSMAVLASVLKVPERALRPVARELVHGKRMVDQIDGSIYLDSLTREHGRNLAVELDGDDVCDMRRRAFVRWYTDGAVAADSVLYPCRPWVRQLFPGEVVDTSHPAYRQANAWMTAERVSLRSAVELAADLGELDAVLRLCIARWWLCESQKHVDDLIATHDLGITAADKLGRLTAKALLLVQKGHAERVRCRFAEAATLFAEAAELARAQGSLELEAAAVEGAGLARLDQGDLSEASSLLRLNVELARCIGQPRRMSLARLHAAKPAEPEEALRLLAQAWFGFRALGPAGDRELANVLFWQWRKLSERGDHAAARVHFERALVVTEELDLDVDRGQVLDVLSEMLATVNGPDSAQYHLQAAQIYEDSGRFVTAAALSRAGRPG